MSTTRRHFLRGLGTTMALPFLASLMPAGVATASSPSDPVRLLYFYFPNGVNLLDWTTDGTGTDYELSFLQQPLAPFKSEFSVLDGLTHAAATCACNALLINLHHQVNQARITLEFLILPVHYNY